MKQSDVFRENAENCARLAEAATNEPLHLRYKRMEAAGWRWPTSKIGLMAKCHQQIRQKRRPRKAVLSFLGQ